MFIGPPGCGKTTTIAKIAAQERARGGQRLGLLAADGFRIGAVEQLRTYADILDAPFNVARTRRRFACLARAAQPHAGARGHGRPIAVRHGAKELFRVVGEAAGVRTHLVLPACDVGGRRPAHSRRLRRARPTRSCSRKLDEADSLSPLVSLLHERQIPISYLGTGQRVPEDLNRATAQLLAASVLGESAPVQSSLS